MLAAISALILFGVALRVYQLGAEPLWVDEAASLRFSERSLGQIWGPDAALETNPPLYYSALHGWLVFGRSEAALRSLSVVAGALTILFTYGLGRVLGGHLLGMIAGLLVAVSRVHIQYSQEARSYAMLIAAAMLSCFCLASILHDWNRPRNRGADEHGAVDAELKPQASRTRIQFAWIGYVIGTTAALYLHNTAVLLPALLSVVVAFAWIWLPTARRTVAVQWIIANLIVLGIWSMWLPVLYHQSVSTIRDFWIPRPDLPTIIVELIRLHGQPFLTVPQGMINKAMCAGGVLTLGVAALVGLVTLRRERLSLVLVAMIVIGQPALLLLISLWRPMFIEKVMLWPTPVFAILLAMGILAFRNRTHRVAAFAMVLGLYCWGAMTYYKVFVKEPWDEIVAVVKSNAHPSDRIIFAPAFTELSFEYYYPSESGNADRAILQSNVNELRQPFLYRSKIVERKQLGGVVGSDDRVWVIIRQINPEKRSQLTNIIHEELNASHELRDSWNFEEHIRVELLHPREPLRAAKPAMSGPHRTVATAIGFEQMP